MCACVRVRVCVPLTTSLLGLHQPFSQDGLQLAGVLEAELEVLEATDGGLTELRAVHSCQSLTHVGLCVSCARAHTHMQTHTHARKYII